jgi:serine/threonine protein kinase
MLGLLQHPNVVQLLDFDGDGACRFIAMEYLDGSDPTGRLRESGPMPFDQVSRIVSQIAAALDLPHARRIVHGDIKSGNVVLVVDQRADVRPAAPRAILSESFARVCITSVRAQVSWWSGRHP